MQTRSRSQFIALIGSLTIAALTSAEAQITIDSQYSRKFSQQGGTMNFTIGTGDFDPSGSDKLVLLAGGRGSGGSVWGKSWNSATWGTTPLITAVSLRSGDTSPTPGGEEVAAICYLDGPSAETTLQLVFNGKMDTEGWFTLLAISGASTGVGVTNGSITGDITTPVSSGSTTIATAVANSLVVAGGAADRTNITPQPPLTTLVSPGGDNFATGYEFVSEPGTVTPTFSYSVDKYTPIVVAAAFEPAVVPADPMITSITPIGGNVWELTLEAAPDTGYEFRSAADLAFDPGTLIQNLAPGTVPVGTIGGTNNSVLTTDGDGNGTVQVTLSGGPADFVRAQLPLPLFSEDFENGDGGFTVVDNTVDEAGTDWAWGAPDSVGEFGGSVTAGNTDSETGCWGTNLGDFSGTADRGYYVDPTDTCLRSTVIDLTGVTSGELSFAQALDLPSGDSVTVNIIDDTTDTVIASDIVTITDTADNAADWETVGPVAIPAPALGQPVRIEWCLNGAGGPNDDYMGWYIDDVVVEDTTP
jgi:hypothetical protein